MSPKNSLAESVIPNVMVFGCEAFAKQLRDKGGGILMGSVSILKGKCQSIFSTKQDSASQEEDSHQIQTIVALWSWTPHIPELWEIILCYLSHPVYVFFLMQPKLTKAHMTQMKIIIGLV